MGWLLQLCSGKARGRGLAATIGAAAVAAFGADEFVRDVGPPDAGARQVDPCQTSTAFYHRPSGKRLSAEACHRVVAVVVCINKTPSKETL